jgi:hypothetical protein
MVCRFFESQQIGGFDSVGRRFVGLQIILTKDFLWVVQPEGLPGAEGGLQSAPQLGPVGLKPCLSA